MTVLQPSFAIHSDAVEVCASALPATAPIPMAASSMALRKLVIVQHAPEKVAGLRQAVGDNPQLARIVRKAASCWFSYAIQSTSRTAGKGAPPDRLVDLLDPDVAHRHFGGRLDLDA